MEQLEIKSDPRVADKFAAYPPVVRGKLNNLRTLIMETAREDDRIQTIQETLKWGEPSYLTKNGSTLRIDWKAKAPDHYAVYFKCTSKLVPTIKRVFGDKFRYEKDRAIEIGLTDELPVKELKACIRMALNYHTVKHLPLLGE